MPALIDKMVETETASYTFKTRDEAEAFFLELRSRRATQAEQAVPPSTKANKPPSAEEDEV